MFQAYCANCVRRKHLFSKYSISALYLDIFALCICKLEGGGLLRREEKARSALPLYLKRPLLLPICRFSIWLLVGSGGDIFLAVLLFYFGGRAFFVGRIRNGAYAIWVSAT